MISSIIEIINITIKFLFVTKKIQSISEVNIRNRRLAYFSLIYLAGYYIIGNANVGRYFLRCIYYSCLIFIFYKQEYKEKNRRYKILYYISLYTIIYESINVVCAVVGAYTAYIFRPDKMLEVYFGSFFLLFKYIIILLFFNKKIEKKDSKENSVIKEVIVILGYVLVVCIKIPFLYTDIKDALTTKMVFLTIICCTVIFLIISKIEKHNAAKEMARIEENNKILSTKLHKSREILPAMVQVLSNVTENNGVEMEQQEAYKLLQEVNDLYGQQLKENNKEDLQLKNFCSTGLKVLDQQLNIYQREAIDKNINFDIYVQAPINELIKRDDIDQLKFQRAVGDLVRNAFRSVEREDKKCHAKGQVLLIIGCRYEEILEINVVDNGAEFPLYVIEAFGKRGITTGGTGNGLADLVEFAKEIKASICLDEFEGRANSFTKKISIIFDKQGVNCFNSIRKELVISPFWNTI